MTSNKKSYFLAPSWDLKPEEVVLGSVIADFTSPQRILSAPELLDHIDNRTIFSQKQPMSGSIKIERKATAGIFATFLQVIKTLNISYSYLRTKDIQYSCEAIETRRFTPSAGYINQAANDEAVRSYLEAEGLGGKVFVVTGIKTATQVKITTTNKEQHDMNGQLGVDVTAASVGPKASYSASDTNTSTITIQDPIVFAIQVEKLRLRWLGDGVVNKEHIAGALLSTKRGSEKYTIEQITGNLEIDEINDIGAKVRQGIDEETGEECEIVFFNC
ncbi:hypothetical protein F4821DRAFT_238886 [Hypoxylon rubiginosum]|uniref:Uncharacterized protein n=1 Tax=Hypoxylon rubiginosum TaxID=110542 RepID=A0ACC0D0K5_9PEZI|nr:hypothetical protein F4821DRAFT_238886 [Hypoxylon rubiginosum]